MVLSGSVVVAVVVVLIGIAAVAEFIIIIES
jgi:hypothetical protein